MEDLIKEFKETIEKFNTLRSALIKLYIEDNTISLDYEIEHLIFDTIIVEKEEMK